MVLLHRVVYSVFLLPGIYVHERNRVCFSEGGGAWRCTILPTDGSTGQLASRELIIAYQVYIFLINVTYSCI